MKLSGWQQNRDKPTTDELEQNPMDLKKPQQNSKSLMGSQGLGFSLIKLQT